MGGTERRQRASPRPRPYGIVSFRLGVVVCSATRLQFSCDFSQGQLLFMFEFWRHIPSLAHFLTSDCSLVDL